MHADSNDAQTETQLAKQQLLNILKISFALSQQNLGSSSIKHQKNINNQGNSSSKIQQKPRLTKPKHELLKKRKLEACLLPVSPI
jgi:hypothetical protein